MMGENVAKMIHIRLIVVDEDLTVGEFIEQVFKHPTLSETYKSMTLTTASAISTVTNSARVEHR